MARELFEDKSSSRAIMAASSSVGFCYSDVSSATNPHLSHQIQPTAAGYDQSNPAEIFNLTTGMEMIGFSKNQSPDSNSVMWKSFLGKNHPSSAAAAGPSKTINNESTSDFYQPHHHDHNQDQFDSTDGDLMDQSAAVAWQDHNSTNRSLLVDDSSLRCVFPCEGNERPSQGLSLSLSSTNPSGIGLQSFELRQTTPTHQQDDHVDHMRFLSSRNSFFTKSPQNLQHQEQQQMMMTSDHEFLGKASLQGQQLQNSMMNFQLRNSKYLAPAQELLNEFCSLGTKQNDPPKHKLNKNKQLLESDVDNGNGSTSSSSRNKLQHQNSSSSLHSLDIIELQKRKAKLLSMLEEVDRRYRHYCDQMKAVVSVFEAAAGNGAATVYSALASKAMSRHFRCLRDGIVSQIQATKKAMGEKDPVAPGASRGETPRLRVLDQTLRQQRAFQQMTMMESHPWRPQRGLPERSVSVLRAWLFEHFLHPYPSDVDKHILARQTGLSRSQVSNWFINARVRLWKPMVEEMYIEETKEQDNLNNNNNMGASSDGITTTDADDSSGRPNHHILHDQDHKPTPDQLVRIDSECLSSIISNPDKDSSSKMITTNNKASASASAMQMQHNYGSYGAMELDFANYGHNTVSFGQDNNTFNGGVSLTLGLQQHGNNSGVSLAFSPASQGSLFYPRDHHQNHHHHQNQNQQQDQMEDCQPVVQYTMLDGEGQNLPYRNLMGAQLLHDLAG